MICGSRFTVLCASSTGRLQLLDLQHQEHPHMRTLPLLPPARPAHLAVHPHKPVLVVACQGIDNLWELRCMHAVTGKLSSTTTIPHADTRELLTEGTDKTPPYPSPTPACPALPRPTLPCPTQPYLLTFLSDCPLPTN